ncbi:MAG TPA: hypothetical protein VEL51_21730 [Vicinamibacterales bacterium]|nr:hypothetical protein [Vicinamibacterales bacterium]
MSRRRKTVAVLCIALVVCAALMPGGAPEIVWAELVPLWVVVPVADVTVIVCTASRSDEQPVSLLSLVLLRAPPTRIPLA